MRDLGTPEPGRGQPKSLGQAAVSSGGREGKHETGIKSQCVSNHGHCAYFSPQKRTKKQWIRLKAQQLWKKSSTALQELQVRGTWGRIGDSLGMAACAGIISPCESKSPRKPHEQPSGRAGGSPWAGRPSPAASQVVPTRDARSTESRFKRPRAPRGCPLSLPSCPLSQE